MSSLSLTVLEPVSQSGSLALYQPENINLIEAALVGMAETSKKKYRDVYRDFAKWLGMDGGEMAVRALIALPAGRANAVVEAWKDETIKAGKGSSTINGRISALKKVVKTGRKLGLSTLALDIDLVKVQTYRDCAGPGVKTVRETIKSLADQKSVKACRDRSLVSLAFDLALRRSEVVSLDLSDVCLDGDRPTVAITGKGRGGVKELRSLPKETVQALRDWIAVRGDHDGPLFENVDRAAKKCKADGTRRLSGGGFWSVCRKFGFRPHGLRHASVTSALDLMSGDVRAVAKHSRHRDIQTVLIYDDARTDVAGKVSQLVATARQ